MGKILKKTTLPILICALLCVVSFALFFFVPTKTVSADNFVTVSGEGYKTSYGIGEQISIPKGVITFDENEYEVDGIVITPSGQTLRDDLIILDETGVYTVEYKATIDGSLGKKYVLEKVEFSVVNSVFMFDTDKSSVDYTYDNTGYNMVGFVEGEENAKKGLMLEIAPGDTFYYKKPINVDKLTKDDILVKLALLPTVEASADILSFTVRLTDCYNPNNYVELMMRSAYASYQTPDTYQTVYNSGKSSANDSRSAIKTTDAGNYQRYYFNGSKTGVSNYVHAKAWLGVSFDHAERQIFTNNEGTSFNGPRIVSDFDDLSVFINAWGGFTSGECFLSIIPGEFESASCRMFIAELAGAENFNSDDFDKDEQIKDEEPPIITVDYGQFGIKNNIPNAYVGCEYPIFPVNVFDVLGDANYTVSLYKRYHDSSRELVQFTGNSFVPDVACLYTIVYTATDASGNTAVELVDIKCLKEQVISIKLDETGLTSCPVGETISVDGYTVENYAGTISVVVSVTSNGETFLVKNGKFVPTKEGTYVVKYTVTDFSNQKAEVEYEINVVAEDRPIFTPPVNFEKYYIASHQYKLPTVTAFNYVTNQNIPVSVFVVEDGVEREVTDGYTPEMTLDGTAQVYYKAADQEYWCEDLITIVDPYEEGAIRLEQFFVVENASVSPRSNKMLIVSNEGSSSMSGEFISPVYVSNFSMKFAMVSSKANVNKISWTLTDAYDSSVAITFALVKNDNAVVFAHGNGVTSLPIDVHFELSETNQYIFNYQDATRSFTDTLKAKYTYDIDNEGNVFNGFPSGYAILSFKVEGIEGSSATLIVEHINQQVLNDGESEYGEPIYYFEPFEITAELNSVVYIPKLTAYDVIDNNVEVKVQITNKKTNTVISDVNGKPINNLAYNPNICFVASEYTDYSIKYTLEDNFGNKKSRTITISVLDKDAPEIVVSGKSSVSGKTINIAKATATDNVDESVDVRVYIWYPDGWLEGKMPGYQTDSGSKFILPGDKFVVDSSGTYRVVFYAVDAAGNVSYEIQTVKVK